LPVAHYRGRVEPADAAEVARLATIEAKKARSERFGIKDSTVEQFELQKKIDERKKRFGLVRACWRSSVMLLWGVSEFAHAYGLLRALACAHMRMQAGRLAAGRWCEGCVLDTESTSPSMQKQRRCPLTLPCFWLHAFVALICVSGVSDAAATGSC
jgi:hypothetical protein